MSYILDALKKSDQKRQRGQVPDLNTVQVELPPEDKKKALWPYILIGILLLNAIILAVVMGPDQSTVGPQSVERNSGKQKPATFQEKKTDIEPQPTHALSPAIQESRPVTVASTVDDNMASSQDERSPVPMREESVKASVVRERTVEEVDSEFAKGMNGDTNQEEPQVEPIHELVTDRTIEEGDREEVVKNIVPEPERIIVSLEDSVVPAEPEPIKITTLPEEQLEASEINPVELRRYVISETSALTEEKPRAQREPLHLMQLPLSVQKELPEFHISAHVYFAKKPASRLVSINGRIVREGDTFVPDLKVKEITSDGVIFSYHEYLFHVPLL
ncbi:MAG: general secretion pathway protein GspB [Thermodesulfobacteriota bacterium]|nr:general secretion pathway protein GspB [Thermodesulfobacteriota bacterium]